MEHSETDNIYLRMRITGANGTVTTGYFDVKDRDDFQKGAADKFEFTGLADVGEILCIEPFVGGDDWWKFTSVRKLLGVDLSPSISLNVEPKV